jgi:hypothetical protein
MWPCSAQSIAKLLSPSVVQSPTVVQEINQPTKLSIDRPINHPLENKKQALMPFEWVECIVRIAIAKFFQTGLCPDVSDW